MSSSDPCTDPSDTWQSLWSSVQRGDASIEDLLVAYLPRLRAFVRGRAGGRLDPAESRADVVASVCRELLQRRDRFELRDEAGFRAWLFTTATNKLRMRHRERHAAKRAREREVRMIDEDEDLLLRGYASVTSPSAQVVAREQIQILERALERLDPDHREVVCLARLAQLPLAEVARAMERTEGSVRGLLARALLKLAEELKRSGLRDD